MSNVPDPAERELHVVLNAWLYEMNRPAGARPPVINARTPTEREKAAARRVIEHLDLHRKDREAGEYVLLVKAVQAIVGACLIRVWPDGLVAVADHDEIWLEPDQAAALGRAIELHLA